jgi:hypothetical protein
LRVRKKETMARTDLHLRQAFDELTAEDVCRLVDEKRSEDLRVEFKVARKCFGDGDERRALAKAISAFANSSGGLIIWGVDARPGPDRVDCAQATVPLDTPTTFMSKLIEHGGGATIPIVNGIEHRLVDGRGGPFAATIVPESDTGPHMAKHREDRYFKRSGGQSYRMEHFDIADMFGRRPLPQLLVSATRAGTSGRRVIVTITNTGRGAALAPYLSIQQITGPYVLFPVGLEGRSWPLEPVYGPRESEHLTFGGDNTTVIHPGTHLHVVWFDWKGAADSPAPTRIAFQVAAGGVPLRSGEIVVDQHSREYVENTRSAQGGHP